MKTEEINGLPMSGLPIFPHLAEICTALKKSKQHFLVLTAETAAGKSTAVPIALLEAFPKKIYMLEPRRLAVLSIANRISALLGETPGAENALCGYRIQLENRISKSTRLEIMTEGILTRRLQEDPLLEDASVVIIDEFHERSIHADLALAFLKEAVEIRDDLFVIVMSATMDTKAVSQYLGSCPVLNIKGRGFPVDIEYRKQSVASAIFDEAKLLSAGKAMLVFLPGIREINQVYNEIESIPDSEILRLHSSIPFNEQKRVLSDVPPNTKRIVLSSAIAETSLTVPGVFTVIDSGLCRTNRMNVRLGMEELVTEPESLFSAEQRAGRAGRLGKGRCIRLWDKNEIRPLASTPEIMRSDLSSLVLECALRNVHSPSDLQWLQEPLASAWTASTHLLELLGCVESHEDCVGPHEGCVESHKPASSAAINATSTTTAITGAITEKGKAVLKTGLNPRLGCVALSGQFGTVLKYSSYAKAAPELQKRFLQNIENRVNRAITESRTMTATAMSGNTMPSNRSDSPIVGLLEGFPDRLAHLSDANGTYQFPSGRAATLTKAQIEKIGVFPEWIIAPEVDAGETEGRIYSWESIPSSFVQNELNSWLKERTTTKTETFFAENKIQKFELTSFGKIVLQKKKLPVSAEDYAPALYSEIQKKGLSALPLNEKSTSLLERATFYFQQTNEASDSENTPNAANSNAIDLLSENPEEWLSPFLGGKTQIDGETVFQALYWKLNGSEVDVKAPSQITLPNGKKRRLVYEKQTLSTDHTKLVIRPVLEIIIQQVFGCFETPKIMGMPVLLKLLSPARRPLQITDDLAGFWKKTWPEICKEMKGRYPKHNWNYQIVQDD